MTSTPPTADSHNSLGNDSYTSKRLEHAAPEHLNLTTRRCFIGPIPEGWLKSHRRDWYRRHLRIHYSSRAATFSAGPNVGRHRRLTGIEGPSASATYAHSFPQPRSVRGNSEDGDAVDEVEEAVDAVIEDIAPERVATTEAPPAVPAPRAAQPIEDDTLAKTARKTPTATPLNGVRDLAPGESTQPAPRNLSPSPRPLPLPSIAQTEHTQDADTVSTPRPRDGTTEEPDPLDNLSQQSDSASVRTITQSPRLLVSDVEGDRSQSREYQTLSAQVSQPKSDVSSSSGSSTWLSPPSGDRRASRGRGSLPRLKQSRTTSSSSFVTAHEEVDNDSSRLTSVDEDDNQEWSLSVQSTNTPGPLDNGTTTAANSSMRTTSTTSLIQHALRDPAEVQPPESTMESQLGPDSSRTQSRSNLETVKSKQPLEAAQGTGGGGSQPQTLIPTGLVRFDVPEDHAQNQRHVKVRLAQMRKRDTFKRIRHGHIQNGQIIKMENMLVRLETTAHEMPNDFTENDSEKIELRTVEKWREFMCVCRETTDPDTPFVLQLYKSRVIPAKEDERVKKRWTYQIYLRRSNCKVNLFSSLDKTIVLWHPSRRGSRVYTMQAKLSANSMEWYTFLRNILGWNRSAILQVNVPDLGVNLQLDKPFEMLESSEDLAKAMDGNEEAIALTMKAEQAAAASIIERCMTMLNQSSDLASVVEEWSAHHRIGLAWKRYDRLEWVQGAGERKMYGTIGMEKSHELELRPKQHYPTSTKSKEPKGQDLVEPPPVEGFLIRLTSQRGVDQKFGRLFYKRLYFSTHNQFLLFNRPAHADPPPPPRLPMTEESTIPSAQQIADKTPLIYSVNPYPLKDGDIEWLKDPSSCLIHDRDAYDESHRKVELLQNCDGLINLNNVMRIRHVQRGATRADENIDSGSDVDFDRSVPNTRRDDGITHEFNDDRTFELVLRNGLVIRLQAYDEETKAEWMKRLHDLVKYWKLRTAADMNLFKEVRQANFDKLKLDESSETFVGQYARKWEVVGSYASPVLYNMCGVSCCRSIHLSGVLYRRPRMHGAFARHLCLLSHGKLLMFQDSVRANDGSLIKHIHHERVGTLDLKDCYIYSGLATANDLLYEAQGVASGGVSAMNRGALPRMWPSDGWRSQDEDAMTCFVIWHGKKSSWFRSQGVEKEGNGPHDGKGRQRFKKVRTLGTEGRSVVFKTRSRAERDRWVLAIGMEIERLAVAEDVRVVGESRD